MKTSFRSCFVFPHEFVAIIIIYKGPTSGANVSLPPFPVSYARDASPCYLFTFLFAKTLEVANTGKAVCL